MEFKDEEGKLFALEGDSWFFEKRPLIVKPFDIHERFVKSKIKKIPVWIRFPGLPVKFWSPEGLSKVGSLVGRPIIADMTTEERTHYQYARVLVEVDFEKEPKSTVFIRDERGEIVEQKVVLEWKPLICYVCGVLGHHGDKCRKKENPQANPDNQHHQEFNGDIQPQHEELEARESQLQLVISQHRGQPLVTGSPLVSNINNIEVMEDEAEENLVVEETQSSQGIGMEGCALEPPISLYVHLEGLEDGVAQPTDHNHLGDDFTEVVNKRKGTTNTKNKKKKKSTKQSEVSDLARPKEAHPLRGKGSHKKV